MEESKVYNVNIVSQTLLPTPQVIFDELPTTDKAGKTVYNSRGEIMDLLDGKDPRYLLVVGPCSIHDSKSALEYADKLKNLQQSISDVFVVVMRCYFEKPRTTVGWKGFINDPTLNDSFDISDGLRKARKLLLDINELGLPCGTEALDPVVPQYLGDLISWTAIGARTTESQTHRELSSGLSSPVGFKNGTNGSIEVAINALHSVSSPHSFLGVNKHGQSSVFHTKGNKYAHIVLRGGKRPNYDSVSIAETEQLMNSADLPLKIMIDCSHANSNKDHNRQPLVLNDCVNQIILGNNSIFGFMLESHLFEGKQSITDDLGLLKYGVSVTDACISWKQTEEILLQAHDKLKPIVDSKLNV